MKKSKSALIQSLIAVILCASMMIGTTFAWFSDYAASNDNIIKSGKLDIKMWWTPDMNAGWINTADKDNEAIFDYQNWEPGYTEVSYIKIENAGNLAFTYAMYVTPNGAVGKLAEVIDVYVLEDPAANITDRSQLASMTYAGTLRDIIDGKLLEGSPLLGDMDADEETIFAIALKMQESAGNEYQGKTIGDSFNVELHATQMASEEDTFGKDYDAEAKGELPKIFPVGDASGDVKVENNKVSQNTTIGNDGDGISAEIPEGVAVTEGTTELILTVTEKENTDTNLSLSDDEYLLALDVHIDGVAADNTVPMTITLKEAAKKGLNEGNLKLYHVENDVTTEMTRIDIDKAFDAHNQFKYDPATGDIVLYMASFSEVALVEDTVNAWKGEYDYTWYDASKTELTIANADQLAAFGAIVGGMAEGIEKDSFSGKTVKLIADINLGDKESENNANLIFYPIGYYNSTGSYEKVSGGSVTSNINSFEGTFDGAGHTIANFYQNTWEMFGDYNDGYTGTPNHYKDAMGLFGYVLNGTVKNLTVDNFSSDGEFTPTGVIAAFADGNSTFENIAITDCNPRVYNTGNGGIIGIAGDTSAANDDHITLKNITVDNSNKISALWGSWDVACGGLVGMYRGNVDGSGNATGDTISFENCHVAAQIDVYNDVCANYQYYAYRYAGMIIGSVRHNTKNDDGKTIPNMTGIFATGCTVNYGDWNDYYYCEFEKNSIASYSEDYQFSRVPHSELNFTDSNGNGVVDADERASVTGCKHTHTAIEDKQAVYLPFHQLFTGYSWGVSSIGLEELEGIENITVTIGKEESVEKFETKFTGDFLYRVGNQNTVSVGTLFAAKDGVTINSSGVHVTIDKVDENANVSGTFTANTTDWTKGTIQFSGTGVVKVTIQDYDFCKPTELIVEVVDATNIISATGTTSGGNFVLLCDVNASNYVYYWNASLYGNGFTYSLNGAPTNYSSSHGHGVLITKNATLDNLVIVGDIYDEYGAYTNNNDYNAAIDVMGDTVIQNCYISGCSAPVSTRANATITNTTLYGGAVANLMIKGGVVTLENVTTANYADGRALVGMGIVAHSDVSESAKLIINGTLKQYNFVNENNIPSDSNAKILYNAMFDDTCSQYHFDTDEGKYVNTGIISMSALFNDSNITDNANTGYVGTTVSITVAISKVNGYVYTQPSTSGSVDNSYAEKDYTSTTQGAVPPTVSFDHTINEVAKTDGSNDYCHEENGTVYISMDDGDSFDWNTSIATITKQGNTLDYTVAMNGTDYTGKAITFNTAGDYTVSYTYTDGYNNGVDENGNIKTYEVTYTKAITINVSVIKPTTKHAEFTFGRAGTASTSTTIGNNTYIMPNVTATSSTVGSITVSGTTVYYPIVDAYTSDGATAHSSLNSWYMCYPVFKNVISITDYEDGGTGNEVTYGSSTTTMPSGLSLTAYSQYFSQTTAPSGAVSFTSGGADTAFKYQASNSASSTPTTLSNVLIYASPTLSNNARDEMYLLVQYKYQENAGTPYYYYVGYHMPQTTVKSVCVTPDTLVTLADGTQKRIDNVTYDDQLLVWDFFNGEYTAVSSAIIFNHGYDNRRVLNLNFEDSITVKVITNHGFYHADSNSFVFIDEANVESYINSSFVRMDGNRYDTVKLTGYSVTEEYTGAYSIQTALHNNFMVEGLFSITQPEYEGWFDYFEIGDDMKYDEEKMQADIEKYGLYTYEDFAEYVTYEQFIAFNGPYLKVLVGRGVVTYDQIIELIGAYVN